MKTITAKEYYAKELKVGMILYSDVYGDETVEEFKIREYVISITTDKSVYIVDENKIMLVIIEEKENEK